MERTTLEITLLCISWEPADLHFMGQENHSDTDKTKAITEVGTQQQGNKMREQLTTVEESGEVSDGESEYHISF